MQEYNILANAFVATTDPPRPLYPSPSVPCHALETDLRSAGVHGEATSTKIRVKVRSGRTARTAGGIPQTPASAIATLATGSPGTRRGQPVSPLLPRVLQESRA